MQKNSKDKRTRRLTLLITICTLIIITLGIWYASITFNIHLSWILFLIAFALSIFIHFKADKILEDRDGYQALNQLRFFDLLTIYKETKNKKILYLFLLNLICFLAVIILGICCLIGV